MGTRKVEIQNSEYETIFMDGINKIGFTLRHVEPNEESVGIKEANSKQEYDTLLSLSPSCNRALEILDHRQDSMLGDLS